MFCPTCKDEFRAGFTRCANCDVDLVADLDAVASAPEPVPQPKLGGPVALRDYCGFLALDDARESRDRLAADGVACEIAIRAAPDSTVPITEEYWLRVESTAIPKAMQILGVDDPAEDQGPAVYSCACGKVVTEDDTVCPQCGANLDD